MSSPSLESLAKNAPEHKSGEIFENKRRQNLLDHKDSLDRDNKKTSEQDTQILANATPNKDPQVDIKMANNLKKTEKIKQLQQTAAAELETEQDQEQAISHKKLMRMLAERHNNVVKQDEITKLSEIIQSIKTDGGKILIYKDQNGNCYIKYEHLSTTEKGKAFTGLPTDPDAFAKLFETNKQYTSISFIKTEEQLQYKIEEVVEPEEVPAYLKESWYLLYQEESQTESKIAFPMQHLNTKIRFDQLFHSGRNRYLVLSEDQKKKLIDFITEIDKDNGTKIDLKTILEPLKNLRTLVYKLYSRHVPGIVGKETPQHSDLDLLETNLQSLIVENNKLENIVNLLLNLWQDQIKEDKPDDDWYSFIKTMNDFKTEFFNSILDVIILFKSTEAERMKILINNNQDPIIISKSIFESKLKEYITNLEEFIKKVTSELNNSNDDYADNYDSDFEAESDDDEDDDKDKDEDEDDEGINEGDLKVVEVEG